MNRGSRGADILDGDTDRGTLGWLRTDVAAAYVFAGAFLGSLVVYYFVGRHQWFVRDDWDYIIGREDVRRLQGTAHWLLEPQAGHWLTVPVLIFDVTKRVFGLGSYWPFLIPTMAAHAGAVLLTRALCRRSGVSAWATTSVCTLLLVFGAGWENMIFAIQISFNLSLLAFLAQLVLIDHDGPCDRRDVLAAGIAFVGLMSSGFGLIFMVSIAGALALRRRWIPMLVVVGPQVVAALWWTLFWEADQAAQPGNKSQLPVFVRDGLATTFDALAGIPGLGAFALIGVLVTVISCRFGQRANSLYLTLGATILLMYIAIGFERVGISTTLATSSRYAHVAAFLAAPLLARTVDELGRVSRDARRVGLIVIVASAAINLSTLAALSTEWSRNTEIQRTTFNLVAGSNLLGRIDQNIIFFPESVAVRPSVIPELVRLGALAPRQPRNPAELKLLQDAVHMPMP